MRVQNASARFALCASYYGVPVLSAHTTSSAFREGSISCPIPVGFVRPAGASRLREWHFLTSVGTDLKEAISRHCELQTH
jgi:hypothetical protein